MNINNATYANVFKTKYRNKSNETQVDLKSNLNWASKIFFEWGVVDKNDDDEEDDDDIDGCGVLCVNDSLVANDVLSLLAQLLDVAMVSILAVLLLVEIVSREGQLVIGNWSLCPSDDDASVTSIVSLIFDILRCSRADGCSSVTIGLNENGIIWSFINPSIYSLILIRFHYRYHHLVLVDDELNRNLAMNRDAEFFFKCRAI